jgi:nondiscriminating aspartyl-tRNA synthetase
MQRILSSELAAHAGERVTLAGWIHAIRALGNVNFVQLRDRAGSIQLFLTKAEMAQLDGLLPESVIEVEGTVLVEAQAPGGHEIHEPVITVLSPVAEGLPFPINKPRLEAQLDTYLNHATVGLRHPDKQAIFRLSSGVLRGFRQTLAGLDFTEIATPKIVASATESGANVFAIDYFGQKAYLAQSPQFYKQMMVGVFERVFEVGAVFRAEPHATIRHINEYVSLDAEMGFIRDHRDVMEIVTRVVHGILATLRADHAGDLARLELALPLAPDTFPSLHFADAQELIFERHGEDCRGEPDLAPQHERWLGEWAHEEHHSDFLFVTGYPMVKRPFYTHPDPEDPTYSNSFDLLFRGMEMVTGGQRLHRYADYLAALERAGQPPEPFEGYLEAFRYGMPPHGGFAIGLERVVMQLVGAQNVRETTLFPRDLHRLSP